MNSIEQVGEYVCKGECEKCGSSDANALYSDGHTYCFSCETYTPPEQDVEMKEIVKTQNTNFNPVSGEVVALPKRKINEAVTSLRESVDKVYERMKGQAWLHSRA